MVCLSFLPTDDLSAALYQYYWCLAESRSHVAARMEFPSDNPSHKVGYPHFIYFSTCQQQIRIWNLTGAWVSTMGSGWSLYVLPPFYHIRAPKVELNGGYIVVLRLSGWWEGGAWVLTVGSGWSLHTCMCLWFYHIRAPKVELSGGYIVALQLGGGWEGALCDPQLPDTCVPVVCRRDLIVCICVVSWPWDSLIRRDWGCKIQQICSKTQNHWSIQQLLKLTLSMRTILMHIQISSALSKQSLHSSPLNAHIALTIKSGTMSVSLAVVWHEWGNVVAVERVMVVEYRVHLVKDRLSYLA